MTAKILLRREAMEAIGPDAAVLDCFAGAGSMWRAVWRSAAQYRGVDMDLAKVWKHPALVYHCKSELALRALDLSRFNIFDLDAYGGPWNEMTILAARRTLQPGERIAVAITDGSVRRAMLGLTNGALAKMAGADPHAPGAHLRWGDLVRDALTVAAEKMGGPGARLATMRQSDVAHHRWGIWHGLAVLEGAQAP